MITEYYQTDTINAVSATVLKNFSFEENVRLKNFHSLNDLSNLVPIEKNECLVSVTIK